MYLSKAFPFFHKYWSHWVNAKTVFEAFVPKLQLNEAAKKSTFLIHMFTFCL